MRTVLEITHHISIVLDVEANVTAFIPKCRLIDPEYELLGTPEPTGTAAVVELFEVLGCGQAPCTYSVRVKIDSRLVPFLCTVSDGQDEFRARKRVVDCLVSVIKAEWDVLKRIRFFAVADDASEIPSRPILDQ